MAQALYNDKANAIADICKTLRISRATLYRYVQTRTRERGTPSPLYTEEGESWTDNGKHYLANHDYQ